MSDTYATASIIGIVCSDIRTGRTQNGYTYVNFSIKAEKSVSYDAEKNNYTFFRICAFGHQAEHILSLNLQNDDLVGVAGEITANYYTNNSNQKKLSININPDKFRLIRSPVMQQQPFIPVNQPTPQFMQQQQQPFVAATQQPFMQQQTNFGQPQRQDVKR